MAEITNDELGRMIAEGFASVDKKIDSEVSGLHNKIDDEVGGLRKEMREGFVVIEDKLEKIDLQLEQIKPAQERITALETHMASMQEQIDKLQMKLV